MAKESFLFLMFTFFSTFKKQTGLLLKAVN